MRSILLFILLLFPVFANADNPILSKYLVKPPSEVVMRQIAEKWEVEHRETNGFTVIVPANEAKDLLNLAPNSKLLVADMKAALLQRLSRQAGWHSFATVQTDLDRLASEYPDLTQIEKYGESKEGRPLRALRILSKTPSKAKKPAVVITSATHGDELITVEVVFGLMEGLLKGYGKEARLTKMVDTHELYFIPAVNADGYYRRERYCNGVDPNRNYPWPENPNRTPNVAIQAIMDFFAAKDVKASIDYHSTGGMIMYPWAYTYSSIPEADLKIFDPLVKLMAQENHYKAGQISKVIYVAQGSSADYYYWKLGTKALGIEIAQDGSPSLIPSMLKQNTESTWRFIEAF